MWAKFKYIVVPLWFKHNKMTTRGIFDDTTFIYSLGVPAHTARKSIYWATNFGTRLAFRYIICTMRADCKVSEGCDLKLTRAVCMPITFIFTRCDDDVYVRQSHYANSKCQQLHR